MSWKTLNGVATIIYGALALVMLLAFAIWHGAFYGAATAVAAAAVSYLQQFAVTTAMNDEGHVSDDAAFLVAILFAVVVILYAAGFLLTIFGV